MVAHEIMRGRYREGFTTPKPIPSNTPLPFTVDLHQQTYTFAKGHRMMVQVQSTLVPALRSQSADVGAEHLSGEGERLQGGDAPRVAHVRNRRRTSR